MKNKKNERVVIIWFIFICIVLILIAFGFLLWYIWNLVDLLIKRKQRDFDTEDEAYKELRGKIIKEIKGEDE